MQPLPQARPAMWPTMLAMSLVACGDGHSGQLLWRHVCC